MDPPEPEATGRASPGEALGGRRSDELPAEREAMLDAQPEWPPSHRPCPVPVRAIGWMDRNERGTRSRAPDLLAAAGSAKSRVVNISYGSRRHVGRAVQGTERTTRSGRSSYLSHYFAKNGTRGPYFPLSHLRPSCSHSCLDSILPNVVRLERMRACEKPKDVERGRRGPPDGRDSEMI